MGASEAWEPGSPSPGTGGRGAPAHATRRGRDAALDSSARGTPQRHDAVLAPEDSATAQIVISVECCLTRARGGKAASTGSAGARSRVAWGELGLLPSHAAASRAHAAPSMLRRADVASRGRSGPAVAHVPAGCEPASNAANSDVDTRRVAAPGRPLPDRDPVPVAADASLPLLPVALLVGLVSPTPDTSPMTQESSGPARSGSPRPWTLPASRSSPAARSSWAVNSPARRASR